MFGFLSTNKTNDSEAVVSTGALAECAYNYCVSLRCTAGVRPVLWTAASGWGSRVTRIEHDVFYLRERAQIY